MRPLASTPSKICKDRVFSQVATFLPFLLVFQGFLPLLAHSLRIPWALVVLVPLAGSSLLMKRMTGRIQKYHHESRKAAGEVSSFIGQMFHTTQAIQLANAQLRVIAHLRQLNDARRHTRLRSFFLTDVALSS